MNSVKLRSRAGADGILNLKVPVGVTNAEVEVVVFTREFGRVAGLNIEDWEVSP